MQQACMQHIPYIITAQLQHIAQAAELVSDSPGASFSERY